MVGVPGGDPAGGAAARMTPAVGIISFWLVMGLSGPVMPSCGGVPPRATHFSGAGCFNGEDLPFLPTVGAGETGTSTFSHSDEQASPGEGGREAEGHTPGAGGNGVAQE